MALVTTALAALVGAFVFELLNVPAGALVGATTAVAIVTMSPLDGAQLPGSASFLAYAAVGWLIGQAFTRDIAGEILRLGVPIIAAVVLLLVAGGLVSFFLALCCGFGPSTAFLAASPGGLSQMSALAAAVNADAGIVMTLHLVRVTTVLLLSPLIVRLLATD